MQNFQDAVQNQFYASGASRGAQQKVKLPQLSEAQLKNLYNQIMPQMQNSMMRKQQERRQSIQRPSDLRQDQGRGSVFEQTQPGQDQGVDSLYKQLN